MNKITEKQVFEFYKSLKGQQVFFRDAGARLGVSHMTVRDHVVNLIHKGLMVREGKKLFVVGMPRPRRNYNKVDENRKKAEAGKAGAEALKRQAFETGVERFTPGSGMDAKLIKERIEAIVKKAEAKGTLHHPRPVFVVLVGEKVG